MIFNEMSITFMICNILSVYVVYRFMNQFFEEKHTCKIIEMASYLGKRFKKRRPVQNTFFVVLYTGHYLIFELFFLFYV